MKKLLIAASLVLSFSFVSATDGYHRFVNLDVLHYEFSLTLNDSTDAITGRTVVEMKVLSKTDTVFFDLKGINSQGKGMSVADVTVGGKRNRWEQNQNRLKIFLNNSASSNDTLNFIINYHGIPADGLIISRNKYGDRTFFADHWPDRADNYLPCIDHPYDKASVDFIITAPDRYSVVSNGILIEESDLDHYMKITHWKESVPLPVKVMTFGAARFAVKYEGTADNIPVWSWVFPQNRLEGFNDYSVALKPMIFYSRLIGEYPYEKLANVQSKTIYGGLENAGAIFYAENSVTGLGKAERLVAHEIAHQWFGDCVTEADWHHVWLSEGFATYLTSMYMESIQGKERLASDMARTRKMILKDFERHQKPVIDTSITNLMDLLSVNSYQKGAWILHMLRNKTGDSSFVKGLRLYYSRFRNSNALTSDFRQVMEDASGMDLGIFFKQWLYAAGQPELKISKREIKKTGQTEVIIEQKQDNLFEFSLELLVKDGSGERVEKIEIKERLTNIMLPYVNVSALTPDPNVKLLYTLSETHP